MERHEAAIFAAELGGAPEIDLHGLATDEAIRELDAFIHREIMRGTEVVKIIHGRGDGILRKTVQKWLASQKETVLYFRDTDNHLQQGAVTFAVLMSI